MLKLITSILLLLWGCVVWANPVPTGVGASSDNSNLNIEPGTPNYTANLYAVYPWSVLYYYGITSTRTLGQTAEFQFRSAGEHINTIELAYTLSKNDNILAYLPTPLLVQLAGNITYRDGAADDYDPIWEFDPYLILRWTSFPWNNYIDTTFGFAEGISYATSVPGIEVHSATDDPGFVDNAGHLLNYLMFETTFALPRYPRLQLVFRIHHRSGAYGLYGVSNAGSNVIGLGVRYLF